MELKNSSDSYSEEIDLQKYWLVLKRRWLVCLGVFGAISGLLCFATLSRQPVYEASGRLLIKTERAVSLVGLDPNLGQIESVGASLTKDPLNTQAEIIRSLPILSRTLEVLERSQPEIGNADPSELLAQLNVEAVPGTDVLRVSFQAADPAFAAAVVNHVMQAYIENNVDSNRAEAVSARQFIEEQLPATEAAVRRAEANFSQFKEQNRIVDLEQEASQTVNTIGSLNSQIDQAQAQLADINAQLTELRRQIGISPEDASTLIELAQSSAVQEALEELQRVQTQLATESTRYQRTHPTVASLERQENALNQLLQERIAEVIGDQQVPIGDLQTGELKQSLVTSFIQSEVTRAGLSRRIESLLTQRATYGQRANTLPMLEKTQRELERQLQAAQTTYETLLNRLQEVQVAENQNLGNARVIEEAVVPGAPTASKTKLFIAAGMFAGTLLGIAAAFLLDLLDQSVKTVKESRDLFGYPLLGVIPSYGRVSQFNHSSELEISTFRIVARDMPNSLFQDAYQMFQANLKFLSSDKELITIVVTSSVLGEGKTEVSSNLAVAIAQVGRRVLLVDADLRNPSIHKVWNVNNTVGLTHIIVGHHQLDNAIQEVMPNLDVLTSGVLPPNPVALLDSKRMASLIEEFADQYEFVIFDTPPIVSFADASIVGRMVDGTVIVVRPGVVNTAGATAAKEAVKRSGQAVLGVVANGVDIRNEPDSYFHYTRDYTNTQDRKSQLSSATDFDFRIPS
jgi:polysaccharide biosynthesis transport protein